MTKEQAREILCEKLALLINPITGKIDLPINDINFPTINSNAKICSTLSDATDMMRKDEFITIEQWNFKALIKIAYDL